MSPPRDRRERQAYMKAWGASHREHRANYMLRYRLGAEVNYDAMLEAQGGGCAICGSTPKTRRLHVDHDHATGKVRGLLCYRCNVFLVRALDMYPPALIAKAQKYRKGKL